MSTLTLNKTFVATATLGAWVTAVKAAGAAIAARPVVPILAGVKLECLAGDVRVSATDYESFAVADVVGGSGSGEPVLLHYKMLLDMLVAAGKRATKRVSDAWVTTIEAQQDGRVALSVNGATFTLNPLPIAEYPAIPSLTAEVAVSVDPALFIRRMDSAMVAVSKDDTLPILTSIRMELANGTLSLLSTDRYRLVLAEMPVGYHHTQATILLSAKRWKAFKKHLSVKGGDIVIRFSDVDTTPDRFRTASHRHIGFRQGAVELDALGIDGDYPKIRALFPDSTEIAFEMDADLLAANVASVSVTAERNTPVRFTYNGIDSLRVDAGTGEDAQAQAFMPYSSPRGNRGFSVAFNPTYLLEVLKDLKGQTIQILHTSAPKPALIEGVETSDVRHMVMPVRLPN
jgi:DNA polymerase III subunit beta